VLVFSLHRDAFFDGDRHFAAIPTSAVGDHRQKLNHSMLCLQWLERLAENPDLGAYQ
jgi:hypothetical protein